MGCDLLIKIKMVGIYICFINLWKYLINRFLYKVLYILVIVTMITLWPCPHLPSTPLCTSEPRWKVYAANRPPLPTAFRFWSRPEHVSKPVRESISPSSPKCSSDTLGLHTDNPVLPLFYYPHQITKAHSSLHHSTNVKTHPHRSNSMFELLSYYFLFTNLKKIALMISKILFSSFFNNYIIILYFILYIFFLFNHFLFLMLF